MKRSLALLTAAVLLIAELTWPASSALGEALSAGDEASPLDLFDAMQQGVVDATFIARDSQRGRIVLTNNTNEPVQVAIPDAFIGVPQVQAQFGGGGGGGFGGGGGGGQQSVGGGGGGRGGGGRGGGGRGGGGRGGGGGRRGGFNIPPEKVVRIDVPLLCLDHGLRDPSSSKPYAIAPIENYIDDPAVIAIVRGYANGDLPAGAAQAAVWHANSGVGWDELAAKLTGTARNAVREPYFSGEEIESAMAIVHEAQAATADVVVEPRPFELPNEAGDDVAATVEVEATEADAESESSDAVGTDAADGNDASQEEGSTTEAEPDSAENSATESDVGDAATTEAS